jgi:phosphotriesterase-related protein
LGGIVIETVCGPVAPEALGVTSMHDHVLSDSSKLQRPGAQPAPSSDAVRLDTLGYLRWNMLASADNLRLDEADLAVSELVSAVAAGQRALLEATVWGLGPDHARLPEISRSSGMTIVTSYGAYIRATLPGWIAELDESALEEHLAEALLDAVPGTDFRAGMLGMIGTTGELPEDERRMLRAAARAAVRGGAAVSVRLEPEARRGLEVLAVCEAEGLNTDRVVFTNADEYMDAAYWDDLAGAGAVLEMCFGTEAVHLGRVDNPSDRERLAFFSDFCAGHPDARHVLGSSLWTKAQLVAYGGVGYAHLVGLVVPELERRGLPRARLDAMLVGEPRRLLDRG